MGDDDWGSIPAEVLEIYFDDLEERVKFLAQLYNDDKKQEALTLCCVYIEGLAQKLYVSEKKDASGKVRKSPLPIWRAIGTMPSASSILGEGNDRARIYPG